MKKVVLFNLLLFQLTSKIFAQDDLPTIFELKTDSFTYQKLNDDNWQILEDKDGKWTIVDVTRYQSAGKFHSDSSKANGVNYDIHYYWLRYRVKNAMEKEVKICLINNNGSDQSDFYVGTIEGPKLHYTTGYLYPFAKKDGLKRIDAIPITLQPGKEILIYNRIYNSYYFYKPYLLSVVFGNMDHVIQENYISNDTQQNTQTILSSLFAGVLLCSCFVNLFFYLIVREKVFVYYILFLIYFSFAYYTDLINTTVFKNISPALVYFLLMLNLAFGIPLFVQFLRHFLKVYKDFPLWDKLLKIISILSPLAFIARFFIEPHLSRKFSGSVFTASRFLFDLGLFMILATLLFYRKDRNRLTRLLIISAMPSAIFWAFGFTIIDVYDLLNRYYNISSTSFVDWLNGNFDIINMISVMWLAISFAGILILRFLLLRRENAQQAIDKERLQKEKVIERSQLMEQQKIELEKTVDERTAELKQSLEHLKSTQSQLIQSEKMASLGELTAGIAHEIQNPLNFVNNFSEVSNELIDELKNEKLKPKTEQDEILENEILNDIQQNLDKINHHGKRADAIVKGMLQHSQSSTGVKEATDINKLADEYLRLAYHGMRAKDNSFIAIMKTDFDNSIGKINIIPQDIGRVLLNLYNNAFYAVAEKQKSAVDGYEPTISVNTKKDDNKIVITVSDNGSGIPQKVVDKIFQPFFTTKPTGQGTGLGLSISYDIVKAHGGEIKVTTKEAEFTKFIIELPSTV